MGILTESMLRNKLRGVDLLDTKVYEVEEGTTVTPSAKSFLADKKIELVFSSKSIQTHKTEVKSFLPMSKEVASNLTKTSSNLLPFNKTSFEGLDGATYTKKPEHMTHLYNTKLVNKDHPVIAFRGSIDLFEAKVLEVQVSALKSGYPKLVEDLQESLDYVKNILKCEVLKKPIEEITLIGLSTSEIRDYSHHPKDYFDINHFAPSVGHGEVVVLLNSLRAQSRSVELMAYNAFKDENGLPTRPDIMEALNRLSSVYYIMMFKALKGIYES